MNKKPLPYRPSEKKIRQLLVQHYGSVTPSAKALRVTRQGLWNLVRHYGLVEFLHAQQRLKPPPAPVVKAPKPPRVNALTAFVEAGQTPEEALRALLVRSHGNVEVLASILGIERKNVWRFIQRHNLVGFRRQVADQVRNAYRI